MFEVVLMIGFLWAGLCRLGLDDGEESAATAGSGRVAPVDSLLLPAAPGQVDRTTSLLH